MECSVHYFDRINSRFTSCCWWISTLTEENGVPLTPEGQIESGGPRGTWPGATKEHKVKWGNMEFRSAVKTRSEKSKRWKYETNTLVSQKHPLYCWSEAHALREGRDVGPASGLLGAGGPLSCFDVVLIRISDDSALLPCVCVVRWHTSQPEPLRGVVFESQQEYHLLLAVLTLCASWSCILGSAPLWTRSHRSFSTRSRSSSRNSNTFKAWRTEHRYTKESAAEVWSPFEGSTTRLCSWLNMKPDAHLLCHILFRPLLR